MTDLPDPTDPPAMKGRFVMDRDGDVWQRLSGGALWRCLTTDSVDTYGSDLRNVCGPLADLAPKADTAEEIRLSIVKNYTGGSELVDCLEPYDQGIADAEIDIAALRDDWRGLGAGRG